MTDALLEDRKILQILPGDHGNPQVTALLVAHRNSELMAATGEIALALYLSRIRDADITLWAAWAADTSLGGHLRGVGALRTLSPDHGEVKFMHTAAAARRRGVGATILSHIVGAARERGYGRISLETGSGEAFIPARALYRAHGSMDCQPFGDYGSDPRSVFMSLNLG